MKAIIASTIDPKYHFFIPITTWCWNKLGVDVICFMPCFEATEQVRNALMYEAVNRMNMDIKYVHFDAPKNKETTYAQCSRLYAGGLDLPDDEILITSDVDMAVFKQPPFNTDMCIWGSDLVPEGQYPMCYASAESIIWRMRMNNGHETVQECLDELLNDIECENFRGNYWGKDQETLYNQVRGFAHTISRARPGTQFATNRVDRDDINWRSYLGPDLVDAHLWRPGYEENNFNNILELLRFQYPNDNFDWLISYREQYIKLL